MFILRRLLAVGFSLAFAASVLAAPNRALVPHGSGIHGTVVGVQHNPANRNTGLIELVSGSGSSRGLPMTVAVNAATRFGHSGHRGRGNARTGFRALHRGQRVRVLLVPGTNGAARVEVLSSRHNRARNRYVSRFHHRSPSVRHHVSRRALPTHRRVAVATVRRNINPIVKRALPRHRAVHRHHRR